MFFFLHEVCVESQTTVEPRFNEPLDNEVLGSSGSVMYGKEPRYNEPLI